MTVLSFHDIALSALFYSGGSNILYPSFGINLFEPPSSLPQIMFNQSTYDRSKLYQLIQKNN